MTPPRPLNDYVLIEPEAQPDYSTYKQYERIIVPDKWAHGPEDRPFWGYIIAKGSTCHDEQVRVGDRILYPKWGWAKLQVTPETHYAIVREADLLAVDTDARRHASHSV